MKLVLLATTIAFYFLLQTAAGSVSVVTYNMGQLSSWGFDFVACTEDRREPQLRAIFDAKSSPIFKSKKFVLFIQEAWTHRIFQDLLVISDILSLYMYPKKFEFLRNNGQITITNIKPLEISYHPYSIDKHSNKGMLYMKLDLGNGKTLGALNVHTGYSNAYKASDLHLVHLQEINHFLDKFRDKSTHFVLGGDFNAGPDMVFRDQQYDSAKVIWEDGLMPHIRRHKLKHIQGLAKKTWDGNNPLVTDPPFAIALSYFFWNLTLNWDQVDSTLDHIFVSEEVTVKESSVVFDRPAKISCYGREDKNGLLPLSDHYGVNAVLEI